MPRTLTSTHKSFPRPALPSGDPVALLLIISVVINASPALLLSRMVVPPSFGKATALALTTTIFGLSSFAPTAGSCGKLLLPSVPPPATNLILSSLSMLIPESLSRGKITDVATPTSTHNVWTLMVLPSHQKMACLLMTLLAISATPASLLPLMVLSSSPGMTTVPPSLLLYKSRVISPNSPSQSPLCSSLYYFSKSSTPLASSLPNHSLQHSVSTNASTSLSYAHARPDSPAVRSRSIMTPTVITSSLAPSTRPKLNITTHSAHSHATLYNTTPMSSICH